LALIGRTLSACRMKPNPARQWPAR
jgi:hypothetical protein